MNTFNHGHAARGNKSKLYRTWCNIKNRCNSSTSKQYKDYGGRGITVCKKWQKFEGFLEDIVTLCGSELIPDGLTIDRIDNDGNYELSNVRLATRKEQNNNKRNNILFEFNGKTQTLKQWCEELGLNYTTVYMRIDRAKWKIQKAITTQIGSPTGPVNKSTGICGVTFRNGRWIATISIDKKRINLGRYKTIEEAIAARKAAVIINKSHLHG